MQKRRLEPELRAKGRVATQKYRARLKAADPVAYATKNREARRKFCTDGLKKIYFVQALSGPIKIGFTTKRIEARLQEVQIGNHEELTVLRCLEGTRELEKQIHDRFATQRIRGEWFRATPELLEFIKSLPSLPERSVIT